MAYIFLTGGLFFAFQPAARASTIGGLPKGNGSLRLSLSRSTHSTPTGASYAAGADVISVRATGIRTPARLPDPQTGEARRQQKTTLSNAHLGTGVSCPIAALTTRLNVARGAIGDTGGGTAPHQNTATEGFPPSSGPGAGNARARRRGKSPITR